MLTLTRISLVVFIFSQQVLSLEQQLDQNHFGQITFDSEKPLIESWISCFQIVPLKEMIRLNSIMTQGLF